MILVASKRISRVVWDIERYIQLWLYSLYCRNKNQITTCTAKRQPLHLVLGLVFFQKNYMKCMLDRVHKKQRLSKRSAKRQTAGHFFLWSVCQVFTTEVVFWLFLIFPATLLLKKKQEVYRNILCRAWLFSVDMIPSQDERTCPRLSSVGQLRPTPTFSLHFSALQSYLRKEERQRSEQKGDLWGCPGSPGHSPSPPGRG